MGGQVFGFSSTDRELVLHKFKSYGDIVSHKFVGKVRHVVPFLDLDLPLPFHCLSVTIPLPFLDLSLRFHCL